MCGEYGIMTGIDTIDLGLPPHMRRIQFGTCQPLQLRGITSACAENTTVVAWLFSTYRDYLRMCGEYPCSSIDQTAHQGLPPHVRRIPQSRLSSLKSSRITSACAENTSTSRIHKQRSGDYLRMCGEYQSIDTNGQHP